MAVIKIPSSNIYSPPAITTNKIDGVVMPINTFQKENGNVLKKEYTVTYYQETEDGNDVTFVGGNSSFNEIAYLSPTQMLGLFLTRLNPYANIPKYYISDSMFVPIKKNSLMYVYGFTIVRRQQWVDLKKQKDDPTRYYTQTITSSDGLKYNIEDNSFTFYLENEEVTDTGIKWVVIGAEANLGTYGEISSRLLSETISVQGTYYSSAQEEIEMGDTNGNVFSLPTNELVQQGNTTSGDSLNEKVLSSVFSQYQSGKEVHTIKCSVGEYYDIYGAKAIDPYDTNFPAIFEKHDIVEPYVFTSQGEVPLSEKADGTPKQFEIIGIDYTYRGVVWQELTLQEYIQ